MKKTITAMALLAFGASSLTAMTGWGEIPGLNGHVNQNSKNIEVSVLNTKIRNSGLDSGTVLSVKCVHPGKSFLINGTDAETSAEVAYGKIDYASGGGDISYFRVGVFRGVGKKLYGAKDVNVYGYAGLKTQIMFVSGLNNKGIGVGPYIKLGIKKGKFGAGAEFSVVKDYFEGGNWFTETNAGGYVGYSF
jgi:hypothetical protein